MSTAAAQRTLEVSVRRGSGDGDSRIVEYAVPLARNQTVLDVVSHIQQRLDSSLCYRFACRVGVCGSCAMRVNGVPRWTCRTHVDRVVDAGDPHPRLELEPLANLPRIRDLMVDMAPFFDKQARADGRFQGRENAVGRMRAAWARGEDPEPLGAAAGSTTGPDAGLARVDPGSPARKRVDAAIECIGCGVCYSACDVLAWRPGYLGPAALNRAWTLVNDTRDASGLERLVDLAGADGCTACHTTASCTRWCPKGLDPSASIASLKRVLLRAAVHGELW